MHPDAYPEEEQKKQRKLWEQKKKAELDFNEEDLQDLGFKREEEEKFNNMGDNYAENNRMMVTDNLVPEDYQNALEEAPESEESNSIEQFIKHAKDDDIDFLRQSLSNMSEAMHLGKEESDEEYQEDFDEIEEDFEEDNPEDKSEEEGKAEIKNDSFDEIDELI